MVQMGFPRDDLASYLSGENPLVLDNFPELGFFRDIVYLFKVGRAREAISLISPWSQGLTIRSCGVLLDPH